MSADENKKDESLHTQSMCRLVEGIHRGELQAKDELIRRVVGRLERLTRKMLHSFPSVSKWEETGDVLQNALMRLLRTLEKLKPENTRAFFGLATEHLRRELLDLNRHYKGACGLGTNQVVRDFAASDESGRIDNQPADLSPGFDQLQRWEAFHEAVERLATEEREVFSLVFYHGWTQREIAELFQVNERTIRRHWQSACIHLHAILGDDVPIA